MSVRQEKVTQETAVPAGIDAANESALAEGASFAVATPENPLKRWSPTLTSLLWR